ncbi:hypothetical protein Gotri_005815, partial [Gossypium trilobum]|nr:hypothetical protein [Gossypium trilobum]
VDCKLKNSWWLRVVHCSCGIRAPICTSNTPWSKGKKFYGCSKYKEGGFDFFEWVENQDGNRNLNEWKGHIQMLLIENREIRIENTEFKKIVKVDEIEKLVRKVAKQKEKLRGYKLFLTKTENDVYFYKVAFITSGIEVAEDVGVEEATNLGVARAIDEVTMHMPCILVLSLAPKDLLFVHSVSRCESEVVDVFILTTRTFFLLVR